jgi:outer membrane protein assembly factor BamB
MMALRRIDPHSEGFGGSAQARPWVLGMFIVLLGSAFCTSATAQRAECRGASPLTTPLTVEWKYTGNYFGNNPSAPVIAKDAAYFVTGNHAYAVSLTNGSLKWRYPSDPAVAMPALVVVTPAVVEGVVYLGAGDGLYALNAADGTLKWHYTSNGGVATTPVSYNNAIYFISGIGRIHAVNVETGDSIGGVWKNGTALGVDAGGAAIADATVANGIIYFTTSNEVLHAIDLSTGVQRWYARPGSVDRIAVPVVAGESVIVADGNFLNSWRAVTGQKRWTVPLPSNAVVPPTVDPDGNTYVVTDNREIYALNTRGRGIWPKPATVDYVPLAAPTYADGLLIVPTSNGGIYAFDAANGELKWHYLLSPTSTNITRIPTKINVGASAVASNGVLYVLSDDGALTAFSHDAPDSLPPTITELDPEQGEYLNGRAPFHIGAKIADEGSGIDLRTLKLSLDGRDIPKFAPGEEISGKEGFIFELDTYRLDYTTHDTEGRSSALRDGHHTATISAKDWKGNQVMKTWLFTIDDTAPRKSQRPRSQTPGGTGGFPGSPGSGPGAKGLGG